MTEKLLVVLLALLALLVAVPSQAQDMHLTPAATAPTGELIDLTPAMTALIDATETKPDAERVAAFHAKFDPVLPGYYDGKGENQAKFDAHIATKLRAFPAQRAKISATAAAFGAAFVRGEAHFKNAFSDYRLTLPVYLVHSMGMQDGGTREIGGRAILFFGADVIAAIHDESTIGPFLDHELFHAYHLKYFPECPEIWCALWTEGLATYVAGTLNPGADDRALLLNLPLPIRPAVTPRLAEAMCGLRQKLESTAPADFARLFTFGRDRSDFPGRYGYFLGYLIAQKIGKGLSLVQLAKLPASKVKPMIFEAVDSYGPCTLSAGRKP
ncbi:MAG: hypothetical protein K2P79_08980 [Sphingomonas sp.]|nr:hypothetical protein [Sphingomonas sp.]